MVKKILITIPAYNEAKNLGPVLEKIKEVMSNFDYQYEIAVINDGSRDKTAEIARNAGVHVISHPRNYGLAEAFRTEMQNAINSEADIIVHTDADGQYIAEEIPLLIKEIENGYDLVLGSRFRGRIESMPIIKKMGNIAFSKVLTSITGLRISDGQTGFRAFTQEVAKLPLKSTHTYTQEQIIRSAKEKMRIKEIPIHFMKREGKSKLIKNPFEYAAKAWINILRVYRDYEPLKFFGSVGAAFVALGFLLGLWLLSLYLRVSTVGHYPTIMLTVLLIVSGIQICLFGFFADMQKR